jgi:hypothetical protein
VFDTVALVEQGRKLAGWDARCASDGELCSMAVVLARLLSLLTVALAHVLCELDARGVTETEHGLTAASWLAREANIPGRVARRHLAAGRVLRDLPVIDDAAVDGALSSEHVAAVADARNPRVADALVGLQPEIVALAEGAIFEAWRADVRMLITLADEDGGHDPARDLATNKLSMAETLDGILHLSGQLVGEHALTVKHAIDTKADDLFRRFTADYERCPDIEVPNRATLRALALSELSRAGGAVDVMATRPPRPEVTLVVRADEPDATPTSVNGARLQDGTTRTLCCDPDLYAVVVDSLGVPLDLGRHVRLASAAQRRAVAARDGGCVFPGCDSPIAWTDNHHVHHHRLGGATAVENLASLCRRHHGITHRKGWEMHATPDGWFRWRTPTGHTFSSQRHGRQRTGPDPPLRV